MLSHPPHAYALLHPRSPSLANSPEHKSPCLPAAAPPDACPASLLPTHRHSITSEPDSTRPHHLHPGLCTADRINPPSIHQSTLRLSLHLRLARRLPQLPRLFADTHTTASFIQYRSEEDTRRLAGGYAIATSLQSWVRALHSLCGAAINISLPCPLMAAAAHSAGDSRPLATCSAARSNGQRTTKMAAIS